MVLMVKTVGMELTGSAERKVSPENVVRRAIRATAESKAFKVSPGLSDLKAPKDSRVIVERRATPENVGNKVRRVIVVRPVKTVYPSCGVVSGMSTLHIDPCRQ